MSRIPNTGKNTIMVKQCLSEFTESMQGTMKELGRPKANVVVAFEMETADHIQYSIERVGTEKGYDQ
jgi:hypothetical protein